jgi:hypothetical protein
MMRFVAYGEEYPTGQICRANQLETGYKVFFISSSLSIKY